TLLQHLTFDLENRFPYENNKQKPSLDLPLLGWLREFYCNFPEYSTEIVKQLVKYGASSEARLQAISLGPSHLEALKIQLVPSDISHFSSMHFLSNKLIHSPYFWISDSRPEIATAIRDHFTSLERVSLGM